MENPDDCPKMATLLLINARDAGVNPGQNGFQILEPPPKNLDASVTQQWITPPGVVTGTRGTTPNTHQQRAQPSQVSEYICAQTGLAQFSEPTTASDPECARSRSRGDTTYNSQVMCCLIDGHWEQ